MVDYNIYMLVHPMPWESFGMGIENPDEWIDDHTPRTG